MPVADLQPSFVVFRFVGHVALKLISGEIKMKRIGLLLLLFFITFTANALNENNKARLRGLWKLVSSGGPQQFWGTGNLYRGTIVLWAGTYLQEGPDSIQMLSEGETSSFFIKWPSRGFNPYGSKISFGDSIVLGKIISSKKFYNKLGQETNSVEIEPIVITEKRTAYKLGGYNPDPAGHLGRGFQESLLSRESILQGLEAGSFYSIEYFEFEDSKSAGITNIIGRLGCYGSIGLFLVYVLPQIMKN